MRDQTSASDGVPAWAVHVADRIAAREVAVVREALPAALVQALRAEALAREAAGGFAPAAVGHGSRRTQRPELRGDRIAWLEPASASAPERAYLALMSGLRATLNRELMLGLLEFEVHYALYPTGTAYARHRDRFRDDDTRELSCVLYLNERWRADHAGALRVYLGDAVCDVLPEGGTLVAFQAARFEHEVMPATRPRLALTGWFRRRALGR